MKCSFCENDLKYVVCKEKNSSTRMEIYYCMVCKIKYREYPIINNIQFIARSQK